jgi:3-hydroxyacyl-CoA dehydrogenase / enoyl-CoA hydratase / 3-hydroxybutyryl-CoA epimerase
MIHFIHLFPGAFSLSLSLQHIDTNQDIKAAVFISSKPDNFIAGADIQMIKRFENKDDLKELCMNG